MVALLGLVVLPPVWYVHGDPGFLQIWHILGWRALHSSGDFQTGLDGIAVSEQLVLMGGIPLLFFLHMISRRERGNHILPWLALPLLFVGTAIAVVVLVTIAH